MVTAQRPNIGHSDVELAQNLLERDGRHSQNGAHDHFGRGTQRNFYDPDHCPWCLIKNGIGEPRRRHPEIEDVSKIDEPELVIDKTIKVDKAA